MPNYQAGAQVVSISPGEMGLSFNTENPAAPQAGQEFYLGSSQQRGLLGVSLEAEWSAPPAAAVVELQVANNQADSSYVTVNTLTFTGAQKVLRCDPAGLSFRYARALVRSHTGAETLTARILSR
jgi:hypothetical protein